MFREQFVPKLALSVHRRGSSDQVRSCGPSGSDLPRSRPPLSSAADPTGCTYCTAASFNFVQSPCILLKGCPQRDFEAERVIPPSMGFGSIAGLGNGDQRPSWKSWLPYFGVPFRTGPCRKLSASTTYSRLSSRDTVSAAGTGSPRGDCHGRLSLRSS